MNLRVRVISIVAVIAAIAGPLATATPCSAAARAILTAGPRRVAYFVDHWFASRPHEATHVGVHGTDGLLPPVTEASLDSERAWVAQFRHAEAMAGSGTVEGPAPLPESQLLSARLERMHLDLDELRSFERDPNAYLPLVDGSIRDLAFGSTGSVITRLRAAARRLAQVPEVLRAAQVNLKRPSRLATETAIETLGRTLDLYRNDLPHAARDVRDEATLANLSEADTLASRAVEGFIEWLRVDMLPNTEAFVPLGADRYASVLVTETIRPVALNAPVDLPAVEATIERGISRACARRDSLRDLVLSAAGGDAAEAARRIGAADRAAAVLVARALRRPPGNAAHWRTRAGLGPASAIHAWAEYVAARTLDADTTAPARGLAAQSRDLALWARLAAEIEIHTRGASVDDAAAMIQTRCGIDSTTARALARRAAIEPGSGAAALHLNGYRSLRDEARTRLGKRFDAGRFEATMAAEAPSPPEIVGGSVLRRIGIMRPVFQ